MSTPFLKFPSAFFATLSLVPTVAAAPIPVSSPTAIAFIASLTVVPSSLILLLIVKYLYVKNRRADTASGHSYSSNPSQLPFLVGLLGSPDWEVQRKESECSTADETNSSISLLPPGRRPILRSTNRDEKSGMFQRLARTPRTPGLRVPPAAHSVFPPDQSFFYALDTPASSTQSSLGNLLSDSALVRLVSRNGQNQLAEPSELLPKSTTETQTPGPNSNVSPSSFSQATQEIKSPPKAKRCTLLRRTPIPSFLPIQTPPDSPILIEPKESSPNGNFVFHLYTPELPVAHRLIPHPYAQSPMDPSTSAITDFPRSPSQEFHSCDEQSPGPHPGHPSPASSLLSSTNHLNKAASNGKSLAPSLLVNPGGGSPFFASTSRDRGPTVPRPASTSYTEESLSRQSPNLLASRSTSAITSAKLVPFSASARASVVSESPSYASEHAYQGGASPTAPYELDEYYDYVGSEGMFPVSDGTESPQYRNSPGQQGSPTGVAAYVGGNLEPSSSGVERKPSFCVPGVLFPIPEEDTQPESSSSRSRSEPTSSSNGSLGATPTGSLPLTSASSYGEFTVSFVSTSGSFRVVNQSTPGASAVGGRRTHIGAGSPLITSTPAQTTYRGSAPHSTSPPNVGTLRVGPRESYPGSGDLNDGTEVSGACMSGLYEELEEWGCEWILQNQQQTSSSTGRRSVFL